MLPARGAGLRQSLLCLMRCRMLGGVQGCHDMKTASCACHSMQRMRVEQARRLCRRRTRTRSGLRVGQERKAGLASVVVARASCAEQARRLCRSLTCASPGRSAGLRRIVGHVTCHGELPRHAYAF